MRHFVALALMIVGFGGLMAAQSTDAAEASGGDARILAIDGAITPLEAKHFSNVIDEAHETGAEILIVQLSTPGGLLESTREMVEDIFASPLPVVVYVSPSGARAASAGTFITAAAHVAAMAPATNIGAASPVGAGGDDLPDTLRAKATQDAAAFLRSIASQRNRNAEALQDTVLDAVSYTATEALELQVVDLKAENLSDLLTQLHGMAVDLNGEKVQLDTDGLTTTIIERTPVEHFIRFLADPNVAFLLLTIGGIGIIIELFSPGLIGPGVVGIIALILAFLAFGNLPVNWVGVGLILLSMALFYLEAQAPGIGIFGVNGAVGFLIGAFLLFGNITLSPEVPDLPNAPSFTVSLWIIAAMSALLFASMVLTIRAVKQVRRAQPYYDYSSSNPDNLIGTIGTTTTQLDPAGSVQAAGEQWSAVSDSGESLQMGERVMIVEVDGLTLRVVREATYSGHMQQ